jgi:Ran GTPase-activating protein (RanGAP) involved in mRNA processing and transport
VTSLKWLTVKISGGRIAYLHKDDGINKKIKKKFWLKVVSCGMSQVLN